jgi:hydrogenase small subunit
VALEYATMNRLPALDEFNRPKFAFDRHIHDHCPRRAHFDAGRFAKEFGDEGHREGWCLYKLGCKGPVTHAACSTKRFNEVPDVWPIGIGAPCVGCTEKSVAFRVPIFETVDIHAATPPEALPLINNRMGTIGTAAAAMAGAIGRWDMARVLILGYGNPLRSDDGLGWSRRAIVPGEPVTQC